MTKILLYSTLYRVGSDIAVLSSVSNFKEITVVISKEDYNRIKIKHHVLDDIDVNFVLSAISKDYDEIYLSSHFKTIPKELEGRKVGIIGSSSIHNIVSILMDNPWIHLGKKPQPRVGMLFDKDVVMESIYLPRFDGDFNRVSTLSNPNCTCMYLTQELNRSYINDNYVLPEISDDFVILENDSLKGKPLDVHYPNSMDLFSAIKSMSGNTRVHRAIPRRYKDTMSLAIKVYQFHKRL